MSRAALSLSAVNRAPAEPLFRRLAQVVGPVLRVVTKQDWRGGGKLPRSGPVIVVANHISNFDPVALGHFLIWHGRWPRALAKSELWHVPVVGWLARSLAQIPVERRTARASESLAAAAEALARGECVVIYPEGTITADPDGWPMTGRPGAARLALQTGVPVVPIGQWGAHTVMPGRRATVPRLLPRATMQVLVGDPVDLADLSDASDSPTAAAEGSLRIMDAISELVGELREETPPTDRYDLRAGKRIPRDWAGEVV
ncbi:MAG TPA: lysophospholipid acyltransferase family protein [Micropruina sp.]|nr:lysophospholipid acyltransferase family protein [Micropruina sp.]HMR22026.1 lysophospholipid acyltransferase family protein [Micropruina sp.]